MSETLRDIYRYLYLARRTEEEIATLYPTDTIKSPIHLSIGQEAVAVGVCRALESSDIIFPTYRGHAAYLAKGGDLRSMVAELYGKATGCAKGKGGSMHLIDVAAGVMGCSAIVASGIPQAVGYAMGAKVLGKPTLVVSFFGDGAVEEGVFHESLNFAALKQLPVLFVCENNGYAVHSRLDARQPAARICGLAEAHGIPAHRVSTGDVVEIHAIVRRLTHDIRHDASGPQFLECATYRMKEHVGPGEDFHRGYRTGVEAAPWIAADQVARTAAMLDSSTRNHIEVDVDAQIADAFAFAEASRFPGPDTLLEDVYT